MPTLLQMIGCAYLLLTNSPVYNSITFEHISILPLCGDICLRAAFQGLVISLCLAYLLTRTIHFSLTMLLSWILEEIIPLSIGCVIIGITRRNHHICIVFDEETRYLLKHSLIEILILLLEVVYAIQSHDSKKQNYLKSKR